MKCIQLDNGPILRVADDEAAYAVVKKGWHYTSKGAYKAQRAETVPKHGKGDNNPPPQQAMKQHYGETEEGKIGVVAVEPLPDAQKPARGKDYGLKY